MHGGQRTVLGVALQSWKQDLFVFLMLCMAGLLACEFPGLSCFYLMSSSPSTPPPVLKTTEILADPTPNPVFMWVLRILGP